MKKYVCAVGLFAAAMLFSGCQKTKETALDVENPVTITVWNYYSGAQQEAFDKLVSEFNDTKGKELGIIVQASSEGGVSDLEEHVMAAAEKKVGAQKMPNVFMAYTDTVYQLNQMGVVEDLNPYFTEEEKAEYVDSYLEEGIFEESGGLMIFPIAKATEVFMINMTDWNRFAEESGLDIDISELATMEGVTRTAKAYYEWTDSLTEEENDGKAFFGRDSMANYMIIGARQLGNPLILRDDSGKAVLNFDEKTVRKLWDNYYVPYINGYFGSAGRFRSDDVKTGTIICLVGSSAGTTFFPKEVYLSDDESYPIETGILEAPQFEGGVSYAVQQGAGMAVAKAGTAEVEASVEFLKWFTDTERNIRFSVESGYLPVKKEANDAGVIKKAIDGSDEVMETIEVAIDTLQNNEASYSLAMENGVSVRNILEYSMSDLAAEDRAKILECMEKGTGHDDAVAEYDTDEHFREWYESVKAELEVAMNEATD